MGAFSGNKIFKSCTTVWMNAMFWKSNNFQMIKSLVLVWNLLSRIWLYRLEQTLKLRVNWFCAIEKNLFSLRNPFCALAYYLLQLFCTWSACFSLMTIYPCNSCNRQRPTKSYGEFLLRVFAASSKGRNEKVIVISLF